MKYYHATPARNGYSILVHGLLISEVQCSAGRLFCTTKTGVKRAVVHMANRHRTPVRDMLIVEFEAPRRWSINDKMRATRWRGVWMCGADIPPAQIVQFWTTDEWRNREEIESQ